MVTNVSHVPERGRAAIAEPRISVVIPTYRRPQVLARLLDALERQDAGPAAFEALVVADEVEDDPAAVAQAIGERRPYRISQLARTARGVSAARNTGWRAAEAPLVLFLGDDMLPAPDLLTRHLDLHAREPDESVGMLGHVEWARELRVTPFMRWLEQGLQFDYRTITVADARWWHFYTANASVKRSLLERVDGFDERFPFAYEDLDLGKRMDAAVGGLRLVYDRDARCEHLHQATLEEWRRRVVVIAGAERRFVDKHPELEPYFLRLFERAATAPRPAGMRARIGRLAPALAQVVPRRTPLVGEAIWRRAEASWRRELGALFLVAWSRAEPSAATL